jgi:hypothetical protein
MQSSLFFFNKNLNTIPRHYEDTLVFIGVCYIGVLFYPLECVCFIAFPAEAILEAMLFMWQVLTICLVATLAIMLLHIVTATLWDILTGMYRDFITKIDNSNNTKIVCEAKNHYDTIINNNEIKKQNSNEETLDHFIKLYGTYVINHNVNVERVVIPELLDAAKKVLQIKVPQHNEAQEHDSTILALK